MTNVGIIGVGALGRRHLQSLYELKDQYNIYAVEVNTTALSALKMEFPDVAFSSDISGLPEELSVVVIATNSNVRRLVFEQLIAHTFVRNIIFEKVLFQKEEDYYFVQKKLQELGIKAWVNCARREWDSYQLLKGDLKSYNELFISATGGQWGLGCNGIHMLDLIEFISGTEIDTLDLSKLENEIFESKRKGFLEFDGTITGSAGKCRNFIISSIKASILPFLVEITTENARYLIDEGGNRMLVSEAKNEWKWQEREFRQVYQSQMTGRIVKSIAECGFCRLTEYDVAMELHLKYIRKLLEFLHKNGWEGDICPIT